MSWGMLDCKWAFRQDQPCVPTVQSCNEKCSNYKPLTKPDFMGLGPTQENIIKFKPRK